MALNDGYVLLKSSTTFFLCLCMISHSCKNVFYSFVSYHFCYTALQREFLWNQLLNLHVNEFHVIGFRARNNLVLNYLSFTHAFQYGTNKVFHAPHKYA